MKKYSVLYIDEQAKSRELFDELQDDEMEIKSIHPKESEKELVDFIMGEKFDAIVVDYGLMKDDPKIKYNGDDVITKINELKEGFPALILTQDINQDNGIDEKIESTKILTKKELAEDEESIKRKIKSLIKFYKKENKELSEELDELVKKRRRQNGTLSDEDLERLNYLDERIERRLHGKRMFPNLLKDSENLKELNNLLKKAEDFLDKNTKK